MTQHVVIVKPEEGCCITCRTTCRLRWKLGRYTKQDLFCSVCDNCWERTWYSERALLIVSRWLVFPCVRHIIKNFRLGSSTQYFTGMQMQIKGENWEDVGVLSGVLLRNEQVEFFWTYSQNALGTNEVMRSLIIMSLPNSVAYILCILGMPRVRSHSDR